MRTDLLLLFADRLDVLHAQQAAAQGFRFDIGTFYGPDQNDAGEACGTVGCAMGWAAVDPALREAFKIKDRPEDIAFSFLVRDVAHRVGVPAEFREIFHDIFLPVEGLSYWYDPNRENPTAADVADVLRRFAGGERPKFYRVRGEL